jgi:SAM-dependent methyltransferase
VDAAERYEAHFVPALFAEWAAPVVDAASVGRGDRVLDVACGTGVAAREALARVGAEGAVVGLDVDAGMLEVARRRASRIEWRTGRAEALPFPDSAFDAVLCQFGLMFFADPVTAVGEMRRVAKPGGRLALAVWDALQRNAGFATFVRLLSEHAGERAADALRAPFRLGDPALLQSLLGRAGLSDARVISREGRARFASLDDWIDIEVYGWLPIVGVSVAEDAVRALRAAARRELAGYGRADGSVEVPMRAYLVSHTAR